LLDDLTACGRCEDALHVAPIADMHILKAYHFTTHDSYLPNHIFQALSLMMLKHSPHAVLHRPFSPFTLTFNMLYSTTLEHSVMVYNRT
jgi:hypothetical protein